MGGDPRTRARPAAAGVAETSGAGGSGQRSRSAGVASASRVWSSCSPTVCRRLEPCFGPVNVKALNSSPSCNALSNRHYNPRDSDPDGGSIAFHARRRHHAPLSGKLAKRPALGPAIDSANSVLRSLLPSAALLPPPRRTAPQRTAPPGQPGFPLLLASPTHTSPRGLQSDVGRQGRQALYEVSLPSVQRPSSGASQPMPARTASLPLSTGRVPPSARTLLRPAGP